MAPLEACRMCLSVDVQMLVVADTPLQALYEKLTNKQLQSADSKPVTACYVCYHMLKKTRAFIDGSLRADGLLQQILDHGLELSLATISAVSSASLRPALKKFVAHSMSIGSPIPVQHVKDEGVLDVNAAGEAADYAGVGVFTLVHGAEHEAPSPQLSQDDKKLIIKLEYDPHSSRSNVEEPSREGTITSEVNDWDQTEQIDINVDEGQSPRDVRKCERCGAELEAEQSNLFDLKAVVQISLPSTAAGAGAPRLQCYLCDEIFYGRRKLTNHMRTHKKAYSCSRCAKAVIEKVDSSGNITNVTGEKQYPCVHCDKVFNQKYRLNQHLKTHTGEKPYLCNQCDKAFRDKTNLNAHILTHTGEHPYACNQCDKTFTQKSQLNMHIRTHTGEKPFSCNQCDKVFRQKIHLKVHIMTHTGEKPYACDLCDKTFAQKSLLNAHMTIHTGKKPYICNECAKAFSRKVELLNHIITHMGLKPYHCNQCDKAFLRSSHLNRHILTHTGVKPYRCDQCDKAFSCRSHLKRHAVAHTGEKKTVSF